MSDAQKLEPTLQRDQRLMSLDALRGFDMFWIIGGASIAKSAAEYRDWPSLVWFAAQMQHPVWHGFTLYDLIFPLFLFLTGVSMPFSFGKRLERGEDKLQLYKHVIMRATLLVILGMVYNDFLKFDWPNTRYVSVLGFIGVAYLFAAFIFLNSGVRGQFLWAVGLLVTYWAALKFIPVPGNGAGTLDAGHTLTDYIDRLLTPGQLLHGDRDPQGIFQVIPAIATALAGTITGHLLKSPRQSGYVKTAIMAIVGLVCVGLSLLWDHNFPINKNLWSSSFALLCAGLSLLLLALFYLVVDVWRFRLWAQFFVVIGSNSILIYMARRFIDFDYTTGFFFGGALKHTGSAQPLLFDMAVVFVEWLLLLLLYKKRIFLRV